ncbi:hypothetical protein CBOM_01115 [Ceraceosorus bombacis]|uniref:Uncharacterized protein n=1 Tax=Ceraceosorus bombacis TaxID=401625 RepID=A0A0P1BCE3_9BASI|nr:hypothetical protein CBOM_01115 [Ceraceosorus bombacis]
MALGPPPKAFVEGICRIVRRTVFPGLRHCKRDVLMSPRPMGGLGLVDVRLQAVCLPAAAVWKRWSLEQRALWAPRLDEALTRLLGHPNKVYRWKKGGLKAERVVGEATTRSLLTVMEKNRLTIKKPTAEDIGALPWHQNKYVKRVKVPRMRANMQRKRVSSFLQGFKASSEAEKTALQKALEPIHFEEDVVEVRARPLWEQVHLGGQEVFKFKASTARRTKAACKEEGRWSELWKAGRKRDAYAWWRFATGSYTSGAQMSKIFWNADRSCPHCNKEDVPKHLWVCTGVKDLRLFEGEMKKVIGVARELEQIRRRYWGKLETCTERAPFAPEGGV